MIRDPARKIFGAALGGMELFFLPRQYLGPGTAIKALDTFIGIAVSSPLLAVSIPEYLSLAGNPALGATVDGWLGAINGGESIVLPNGNILTEADATAITSALNAAKAAGVGAQQSPEALGENLSLAPSIGNPGTGGVFGRVEGDNPFAGIDFSTKARVDGAGARELSANEQSLHDSLTKSLGDAAVAGDEASQYAIDSLLRVLEVSGIGVEFSTQVQHAGDLLDRQGIDTNAFSIAKVAIDTYAPDLREVLGQRLAGDVLENALDLAVNLQEKGGVITPNGNAVLYHRTTQQAVGSIIEQQAMFGKEDGLFFGTSPTGQIDGYGDSVVRVEIPLERLLLNDVFPDEAHVRMDTGVIGELISVEASEVKLQAATANSYLGIPEDYDLSKTRFGWQPLDSMGRFDFNIVEEGGNDGYQDRDFEFEYFSKPTETIRPSTYYQDYDENHEWPRDRTYDSAVVDADLNVVDQRYSTFICGGTEDNEVTMFRGMSGAEWKASVERGYLQSEGTMNLGEQEGMTLFATAPSQAESYAMGFAPWYFQGSYGHPNYIIEVRRPTNAVLNNQHELEVPGQISIENVVSVREIRVAAESPGRFDLRMDPLYGDGVLRDGSASPPTKQYVEREVPKEEWQPVLSSNEEPLGSGVPMAADIKQWGGAGRDPAYNVFGAGLRVGGNR